MHDVGQVLISVVVPCFDEEESIGETHRRLSKALATLVEDYEIIYVNDGSRDRTLAILTELHTVDAHVRVVDLSRNFGHQVAVTAGIDFALGAAVVLIDADLQDPPELIPAMLDLWKEGFAVVYGQRNDRRGESAFKKATARAFYRTINRLSDVPMPLDTGDFRLMDRKVVDALKSMPERDRFIRGMVSWVGFRQTAIRYDRDARFAGSSKYPLRKMLAFAVDGLVSFSTKPLRVATLVGFLAAAGSFCGILYALYIRLFTSQWVSGWAMIMIVILLLGGAQLVCLGVIGEYVGRIYQQTKARPLYIVRSCLTAHRDPRTPEPTETSSVEP